MTSINSVSAYVGPDYPSWKERLNDGSQVLIRPIRRQDAAAERCFLQSLSPESKRSRFLGEFKSPSDTFIEKLTDIDYVNDVALVALTGEGENECIVGVSRYAVDNTRNNCECAVVVADAWQGKGLGTSLMRHLIRIAQDRGLRRMVSMDLASNTEMKELASYLGFRCHPDPNDGHQVIYSLTLDD